MFSVFWWPIIGVGALAGDVLRVGRGNFEADRRGLAFGFLLIVALLFVRRWLIFFVKSWDIRWTSNA